MKISNGVKKAKDIKKTSKESQSDSMRCPIFKSKNEEIEEINKAINKAKEIGEKAYLAEKLIKEANRLLACKLFEVQKPECKICHYLADLRKKTANLILKAKELKIEK